MNPRSLDPAYRFYPPKLSRFWAALLRPLHLYALRRVFKIHQILIEDEIQLLQTLQGGGRLLITPNHPAHGDPTVLAEALHQLGVRCYYMAASQVFTGFGGLKARALQRLGVFSIDREGADLRAFRQAVEILTGGRHPLVIFPEGEVYHLNDRLTPLREGVAAIALSAARRPADPQSAARHCGAADEEGPDTTASGNGGTDRSAFTAAGPQRPGPVYCIPCALKYFYLQDPTPALQATMDELERRIYWRPQRDRSLPQRIYKYAEAILSLKEREFTEATLHGPLPQRIQALIQHVLGDLERAHFGQPQEGTVPVRVKNLRWRCTELVRGEIHPVPGPGNETLARLQRDFDDLLLVSQLFSYPGDYVAERPTIERIAETVQKFQEDALGIPMALPSHPRRAVVKFGPPINVNQFLAEHTGESLSNRAGQEHAPRRSAGRSRQLAALLTAHLEGRMQALLDGMAQTKARPWVGRAS